MSNRTTDPPFFKLQLLSSKSLERLADLRKAFPDKTMRFIHLPSMRVLDRGDYDLYLKDDITEMGITHFPAVTECDWPEGLFIPEDGHPNAIGYTANSNYVATYLGLVAADARYLGNVVVPEEARPVGGGPSQIWPNQENTKY